MPANPKAIAMRQAVEAQRNYEAGLKALQALTKKRAEAITKCLDTGCTLGETASIFGVSRSRVQQLVKQHQEA